MDHAGIAGTGIYIPETRMSAAEISKATGGVWSEEAVIEKLGIISKPIPGSDDGTQEMGAWAALDCLKNTGLDPKGIDVILCIGEEWKEYPLTTSALYIQDRIGAVNAWGIDVQNRCCTCCTAIKMAVDMLIADPEIKTVMVVGGYRNGDFVDYADKDLSMMYDLAAGAGAMILKKNYGENIVLGSHVIADGSLSRAAGVKIGGINEPFNSGNTEAGYRSLTLFDARKMKDRLKEVSMTNWYKCIDESLRKGGKTRDDIGFLAILHFKKSAHMELLKELGLREDQSIYLDYYGHLGQIDQILSIHLGLKSGQIKPGTNVVTLAAGIGYVWAANLIQWG
ncbi:3-oxoacyl-[acyl-carrier-protein] synthase 3 [Spirochaetia bacterium]|nr:3-oxoacyl-[acyl-carrier-protein] synthase 3 [Spirochaetia bacterium]